MTVLEARLAFLEALGRAASSFLADPGTPLVARVGFAGLALGAPLFLLATLRDRMRAGAHDLRRSCP